MTKRGELPYRERLLALDLLPLTYDREVRDLVYFFKSLFNYIDVNIDNSFKHYLKRRYYTLISNVYDVDMA